MAACLCFEDGVGDDRVDELTGKRDHHHVAVELAQSSLLFLHQPHDVLHQHRYHLRHDTLTSSHPAAVV